MGCRVFVCVLVLWVMALAGQAFAELNSVVAVAWAQPVLSGTVYGLPARVQGEQLTLIRQKLYGNDSKLNQTFWRHGVLAVTLEPQSTRIAFDDLRRTVEVLDVNPTPVKAVLFTGIPAIDQSPGLLFSGRETIRLVMDTLTCMTGLKTHDTYTLCPSSASTQTLTVLSSSDAESTIMRHNPEKTPVPSLDAFDGLAVESTLAEEESDSHRPSLALWLTDGSRVQFEIEPTAASGQQVSFSVGTVGASDGVGKSSTHAEPSSKSDNNNGDGKNHIPQSGTPSYPSETKSLRDRSPIQTNKITSIELRELILEKKFSNDVCYRVEGGLYLDDRTGLTALPENLSVGGNLYLGGCTGLTALPENLSVEGDLYLGGCTGLTALPENLSVEGDLYLDGCTALTALPKNFSVGGDLSLDGCTALTALPENLSVGGDLSLDGCTALTALPENLSVGGDLSLDGCTGLTALPENLSVGGFFSLDGCTALAALPENFSVGGDLSLDGCTALTALPENLSVEGDLSLDGCTALTARPENFSVGGDLSLDGCTALTALPENLSVGGDLSLDGCTALTALPENFSVGGDLSLDGCTALTALPENFSVGGDLSLDGCTALTALPENFSVGGDLSLDGCTGLTALPENLSVGGDLFLKGCTGLTALPENLSVGGDLFLKGCTGLTALPENLSVEDYLTLDGCTGLTALPENLSVGGRLSLDGCTGLTALPENLSVGGNLSFSGCTGLTALPENLSVGGDLSLDGCTGLTALPNWITTMGLTSQGSIRSVYLENSGLSDALIDRMRTIRTPNMQFHFSRSAGQPEQQFSDLEQGFAFWRRLASSNSEIPELDLRHDQDDDLVCYLGRLTGTADYQNHTSRPVLAQRVMAVMSLLAGNVRVRETALRHIHDALSSCDDRIILALDDLETLQLLTSAETLAFKNRDPRELKALGLQMMRLDAVKRFARDHMKTLSWVDAIEVELAFQIGVRQQLDLPGSTQHMIFRGCAHVSDQDIANAVQHVNTHCSETQLEVYLAQWTPWQKFQRLLAAPSFDQLVSTTVASIDDCFYCGEKTNKMVMLSDIHLDYDALVKAYLENGKNPFTNTPMDWSSVVRLIE